MGFHLTRESKSKCMSTLQQGHLWNYQCIHGGSTNVAPSTCTWFCGSQWHHIATIIFQQRNNYVIDFCFHLTKVKCEQVGVMYTTYKIDSKHTNNAHSSNTKYQRKLNICLGEFQDSLNDAMHEDNPPIKDSYALIKIPKPPPVVHRRPFKNVGVQQKTCMENINMVEATKRSTKIQMTSIKSSIVSNSFTNLDIEKLQ